MLVTGDACTIANVSFSASKSERRMAGLGRFLGPDAWTTQDAVTCRRRSAKREINFHSINEPCKTGSFRRPGRAPKNMYKLYDDLTWNIQNERQWDLADMVGTGGTTTTQSGPEGLESRH